MRIYELARELGKESVDLLAICKKLGLKQANRLSGVSGEEAAKLRDRVRELRRRQIYKG